MHYAIYRYLNDISGIFKQDGRPRKYTKRSKIIKEKTIFALIHLTPRLKSNIIRATLTAHTYSPKTNTLVACL